MINLPRVPELPESKIRFFLILKLLRPELTISQKFFFNVTLIPSFSVSARRLHDVNRSGWWVLLYLTIIGIILLIIWYATEGEKKKNRFGRPVKIK